MMPRVGQGRRPGVFYNTGHGHLGWTLSAATAQIAAAAVEKAMPGGSVLLPKLRVDAGQRHGDRPEVMSSRLLAQHDLSPIVCVMP